MADKPPCTKCKGTGLQPRDGEEARKDLWPNLAATEGLCDHCIGSQVEPAPNQRRANIEAAKSAEGG
jgi:hypothetical protein